MCKRDESYFKWNSPIVVVITKVVIGNRIGWVISSLFDELSEW